VRSSRNSIRARTEQRDDLVTCANCDDTIGEDYAEVAGWRYWSDGVCGLELFCEILFGSRVRA
jgi:hypothetical protein